MPVPGPLALGRGVLVRAGQAPPTPWTGAPVLRVDDVALDEPQPVVDALHRAWATRQPVVIELGIDPADVRAPRGQGGEPWQVGPSWTPWFDRLHFLLWANTYDAREGDLVWWWGRKAARLGATAHDGDDGDVVLPDGSIAWVDGGPRGIRPDVVGAVVHSESVDAGSMRPMPVEVPPSADLAPDQLAAVAHGAGPARVSAPAGSGKTRVLTERLRHLLADRGYEPGGTLAVAYNKQAQLEMAARTTGVGARIQTLNAWGYQLVGAWLGSRPDVIEEREVRTILEGLVPKQRRRVNTDPMARYLEGLSLIRLGLRDPDDVEALFGDVPGLAAAYEPYRETLRRRGVLDFDEQVYLAVEALLADGEFRRSMQVAHRHLLVDEFQDLTPAHVLLVRLLSCPGYDVFAVGDDDQTIYGHAGADPGFLVDFADHFPAASAYALEVNHRCPAPVTQGAATLLSYNRRRVDKVIRPGDAVVSDADAFEVRTHPAEAGAVALTAAVTGWIEEGVPPSSIAVLSRVHSLLLAPHVALAEAGVPLQSTLDESVLGRLGVRAALAYLRIAASPERFSGGDLLEVYRRPSRGMPNWVEKWLKNCRSITDVRKAASTVNDDKVGQKLDDLAADLDRLAVLAAKGADARGLLLAVRDDIGLGSAMTLLDATGGASASHLDDIEALLQVADLHPDVASFEPWLRRAFHRERSDDGVVLSTVHRVKGREWPRVVVFGATDGIMPHRLSIDVEEERRILHVAITRGRERVLVLGDASRRSRFLDELAGTASHRPAEPEPDRSARVHDRTPKQTARRTVSAEDEPLVEALKAWRLERSRADEVPAYVVVDNKTVDVIAARRPSSLQELLACPGIGPAKLESYGDDILEVIRSVAEA